MWIMGDLMLLVPLKFMAYSIGEGEIETYVFDYVTELRDVWTRIWNWAYAYTHNDNER